MNDLRKAVDHCLRQSTRWGGEWVVYETEPGDYGVCAKAHKPENSAALFITEPPDIGFSAVGQYTSYGEDQL